MSAPAYSATTAYAAPSQLGQSGDGKVLSLSTDLNTPVLGDSDTPFFFQGQVNHPYQASRCLRTLSRVVASRFHIPPAMLERILRESDPVITAGNERLRFEGFSGCCSTYARVDFPPESYSSVYFGKGTTNVDFNVPMTNALAQVRGTDAVSFAIGNEAFSLIHNERTLVEKKVTLPQRWIKGMANVQCYQALVEKVFEGNRTTAMQLVRSIPKSATKADYYLNFRGRQARFSPVKSTYGVRIGGIERLRLLEDLLPVADTLKVYADTDAQITVWEIIAGTVRFTLSISAQVWRGFSGEGQGLEALQQEVSEDDSETALLEADKQGDISVTDLASRTGKNHAETRVILTHLAAQGLLGFDASEGVYFHRVLPYDLSLITRNNPRLVNARKLFAQGGVQIEKKGNTKIRARVRGSGVFHTVVKTDGIWRCTCPWHAKHQGQRGPCKHILAVKLALES